VALRDSAAEDGDELEMRRTSLMTSTLKMSAASGTSRNSNISVDHDQADQNVAIADELNGRTSHLPAVASYAQK